MLPLHCAYLYRLSIRLLSANRIGQIARFKRFMMIMTIIIMMMIMTMMPMPPAACRRLADSLSAVHCPPVAFRCTDLHRCNFASRQPGGPSWSQAYTHAHMHTYIHDIHAYIHAYLHAYISMFIVPDVFPAPSHTFLYLSIVRKHVRLVYSRLILYSLASASVSHHPPTHPRTNTCPRHRSHFG